MASKKQPADDAQYSQGEYSRALNALKRESERGCALVAAELLSDALEELLRTVFGLNKVPRKEIDRLLKGFNAPLGTFGMRATFCRAFGLIPKRTSEVLTAIREIRNHCAHAKAVASLDDNEIAKKVHLLRDCLRRDDEQKSTRSNRAIFVESSVLTYLEILDRALVAQAKHHNIVVRSGGWYSDE